IIGRAIFGLHEPARRRDAEDIQVVLDAAADEPAIAVERVGVETGGRAAKAVDDGGAGPVRAAVTAVDIGKNVRCDEVTDTHARSPRILHLDLGDDLLERIVDVAPQAADLTVGEETDHPGRANLPVIADTDGAEPAVAALVIVDAERNARDGGAGERVR